jgi:hypothetical protein
VEMSWLTGAVSGVGTVNGAATERSSGRETGTPTSGEERNIRPAAANFGALSLQVGVHHEPYLIGSSTTSPFPHSFRHVIA